MSDEFLFYVKNYKPYHDELKRVAYISIRYFFYPMKNTTKSRNWIIVLLSLKRLLPCCREQIDSIVKYISSMLITTELMPADEAPYQ